MDTVARIKTIAKEKGVSISHLCRQIGFSTRTYFSDVERFNREIPMDKLVIIAETLNTSVDYLLGNTEDSSASDKKDNEILALCAQLSADDRKDILEFIKFKISQKK